MNNQKYIDRFRKEFVVTDPLGINPPNLIGSPGRLESFISTLIDEARAEEVIICAAIRAKTGQIIRGHRHNDCLERMARMEIDYHDRTEGFITSRNRFVDRKEGREIQDSAGIKSANKNGYFDHTLYSEDLY